MNEITQQEKPRANVAMLVSFLCGLLLCPITLLVVLGLHGGWHFDFAAWMVVLGLSAGLLGPMIGFRVARLDTSPETGTRVAAIAAGLFGAVLPVILFFLWLAAACSGSGGRCFS